MLVTFVYRSLHYLLLKDNRRLSFLHSCHHKARKVIWIDGIICGSKTML